MKLALPLAAAFGLTACATLPASAPIRADGNAALAEQTRAGPVVLTPMRVVEDSRCPMNARCVWAGRAIVETRIDGAGWRETRNLELGVPLLVRGLKITLVAAEPGKMAGQDTPPSAYRFTYEAVPA